MTQDFLPLPLVIRRVGGLEVLKTLIEEMVNVIRRVGGLEGK